MKTQMFAVIVASFIGKGAVRKETINVAAKDNGDARNKVVGLQKHQVPVRNKRAYCYATITKSMHTWPLLKPTGEIRCVIDCRKV